MKLFSLLLVDWLFVRRVQAFVPSHGGAHHSAIPIRASLPPDSFDNVQEKLDLLQDSLSGLVDLDQLDLVGTGPWALTVAAIMFGMKQRSAGSEEAKREILKKIGSGELNVDEVRMNICLYVLVYRSRSFREYYFFPVTQKASQTAMCQL